MKKIICDLCEGTEFIKEGGMFVCQGCGTKYSIEEAKKMMTEVEGDTSSAAGVASAMSTGNTYQPQIDNILILATTAYEAQNYAETENYCNKAIELDAMCYKAWNLKGKAVGWQSAIDNMRITEASHSFCKAIDFAPEEEKENLKDQAVDELKKLGLALITLRKERFSFDPSEKELHGFTEDKKTILDALLVLLSHGNAVDVPKGYLEEVAKQMNEAGVAALNLVRIAWAGIEHPSEGDLDQYLKWNTNICTLFRQAINTSDEDDEEDIERYQHLITALKDPFDKHSQTREWSSVFGEYVWRNQYYLSEEAKNSRLEEVSRCEKKIKNLQEKVAAAENKAREEKLARIRAYWEEHADEKAALVNERNQLNNRIPNLTSEIDELDKTIKAIKDEKTPSEIEVDKLKNQIAELEIRKANLGLFSGKEKKQIEGEEESLRGRIDSLSQKISEEKAAKAKENENKLNSAINKKSELNHELTAAKKRIASIEKELSSIPEEELSNVPEE